MSTKRFLSLSLSLACLFFCFPQNELFAQGVAVKGSVTNAHGQPVPGVTVSMFHETRGRSAPSLTDEWGRYSFYGVPTHPHPYYIEVYWGNRIIYRSAIQVRGPVLWQIQIR